jgi:hypothetical protein
MCNRLGWTITAAQLQTMTDAELIDWGRRAREAFKLAQVTDLSDSEAEIAWQLDSRHEPTWAPTRKEDSA